MRYVWINLIIVPLVVTLIGVAREIATPCDSTGSVIFSCSSDVLFPFLFYSFCGFLSLVSFIVSALIYKNSGLTVAARDYVPLGLACGAVLSVYLALVLSSGVEPLWMIVGYLLISPLLCLVATYIFSGKTSNSS